MKTLHWQVAAFSLMVAAALLPSVGPAAAQVVYAQPSPLDPFFSSYDESYGTSPSFRISPRAYGEEPAVQVVERCQYPNGWNVTDFGRDVNGTPNGLDHACPVPSRHVVRGRY